MKLEFLDQAKSELRAAREHYETERPGLGREFMLEVRDVVRQIAQGLLHFQKVPRSRTRRAFLKQFPFKIVFLVGPDMIVFVAVAHQHRRPSYWRGRV
jgi:plasmid stabilization system protein ParE